MSEKREEGKRQRDGRREEGHKMIKIMTPIYIAFKFNSRVDQSVEL